jgi:hypothetical protein
VTRHDIDPVPARTYFTCDGCREDGLPKERIDTTIEIELRAMDGAKAAREFRHLCTSCTQQLRELLGGEAFWADPAHCR